MARIPLQEEYQQITKPFDIDDIAMVPQQVQQHWVTNMVTRTIALVAGIYRSKPKLARADHVGNIYSGVLGAGFDLVYSAFYSIAAVGTTIKETGDADFIRLSATGVLANTNRLTIKFTDLADVTLKEVTFGYGDHGILIMTINQSFAKISVTNNHVVNGVGIVLSAFKAL